MFTSTQSGAQGLERLIWLKYYNVHKNGKLYLLWSRYRFLMYLLRYFIGFTCCIQILRLETRDLEFLKFFWLCWLNEETTQVHLHLRWMPQIFLPDCQEVRIEYVGEQKWAVLKQMQNEKWYLTRQAHRFNFFFKKISMGKI